MAASSSLYTVPVSLGVGTLLLLRSGSWFEQTGISLGIAAASWLAVRAFDRIAGPSHDYGWVPRAEDAAGPVDAEPVGTGDPHVGVPPRWL